MVRREMTQGMTYSTQELRREMRLKRNVDLFFDLVRRFAFRCFLGERGASQVGRKEDDSVLEVHLESDGTGEHTGVEDAQ